MARAPPAEWILGWQSTQSIPKTCGKLQHNKMLFLLETWRGFLGLSLLYLNFPLIFFYSPETAWIQWSSRRKTGERKIQPLPPWLLPTLVIISTVSPLCLEPRASQGMLQGHLDPYRHKHRPQAFHTEGLWQKGHIQQVLGAVGLEQNISPCSGGGSESTGRFNSQQDLSWYSGHTWEIKAEVKNETASNSIFIQPAEKQLLSNGLCWLGYLWELGSPNPGDSTENTQSRATAWVPSTQALPALFLCREWEGGREQM